MNRKYCLDKKEWEEAQAALLLAKQFGLIEDAGIEALEKRRAKKNKENSLYGVRFLFSSHVSSVRTHTI